MEAVMNYTSTWIFVMACLVFGVNIAVEVVKKLFPKVPTTIVTTVLSEVVTVVAYFAWVSYAKMPITWYCVAAAFGLGIFVAYAAMFGFDKFKEAFEKLKNEQK